MASAYVEKRRGKLGMRYRAVLEWRAGGKIKRRKEPWTRYWRRAKKKVDQLMGDAEDIRLGIKKARERHTWKELTDRWKKSRVGRALNTQVNYDRYMIEQVTAFWDDCALTEITREHCVDLREHLRANGLVDTTVKMRLQALKTCLYFAKNELGWIDENPMVGVEIPEGADVERVYGTDEFWRIFDKSEERFKGPLLMSYLRGVRKAELFMMDKRMLWTDDDGDRWIRLRKPTRFGIRSSSNLKTKRKGERDVHIPPEAIPYMDLDGDEGPIFHDERGRPLTVHVLRRFWRMAKKAAGFTGRGHRWHDWKHTAVTRLLEEGASLLDVKRLTGNTLESLQRYEHIGQRSQKRVMSKLPERNPPPNPTPSGKRKKGAKAKKGKSSTGRGLGAPRVELGTSRSQSVSIGGSSPSENGPHSRCPTCGQQTGSGLVGPERVG